MQATRQPFLFAAGLGILALTSPLLSAATRFRRQIATGSGFSPLFSSTRPRLQAGSQGRAEGRPGISGKKLGCPLTHKGSLSRPAATKRVYSGAGGLARQAPWQSWTLGKLAGAPLT